MRQDIFISHLHGVLTSAMILAELNSIEFLFLVMDNHPQ